jgi:SAM-dependent methyltransferase
MRPFEALGVFMSRRPTMIERTKEEVRDAVREHYGQVAKQGPSAGCAPGCCGAPQNDASLKLGYQAGDLASVPEGADLGLGCGNPQVIAALRAGETVLDLGSGGGFDSFLAARQVASTGHVIGVDMTPEMITKARRNAQTLGASNVEFRLGEIEHLPVVDASVDVIISNCVINLSPDKSAVFREAFRVLKPGGRLAISDVIAVREPPPELKGQLAALAGCVAGAASLDAIRASLAEAGFGEPIIDVKEESRIFIRDWMPGSHAEDYIASATIQATKPKVAAACCGPSCCEGKN